MQHLLDLETLLLFLGSRRQSGELSTDLKRLPGIAHKGPCHVHIVVIEGKVTSCRVYDPAGIVLIDGDNALQGLQRLGQLDWTWSAAGSANSFSTPARPSAPAQGNLYAPVPDQGNYPYRPAPVPRLTVPLERINQNALSRKYWQVLLQIDGSRTIVQIAYQLMASPSPSDIQEVIAVLTDLQRLGIVVMT
jgi:hypothetical protein